MFQDLSFFICKMGLVKALVLSWVGVRMKWDYICKNHLQTVKCIIKDNFDRVCVFDIATSQACCTKALAIALMHPCIMALLIWTLCPSLIIQEAWHFLPGQETWGRCPITRNPQHSYVLKQVTSPSCMWSALNWTYSRKIQKGIGASGSCIPSPCPFLWLFESVLSLSPITLPSATNQSYWNQLQSCLFHLDFNLNF